MTTLAAPPRPATPTPADGYTRAAAALATLATHRDDAGALLEYLKSLVQLGLAGAARRMIERVLAEPTLDAELRTVLNQIHAAIAGLPSGVKPWSAGRATFEANLAALPAETAARLRAVAPDLARLELYRALDGQPLVLQLDRMAWGGGLCDAQAAARAAFEPPNALDPSVAVVFDGIGTGALLGEFAARSHNVFLGFSPPIVIVEPDPLALAAALHLFDGADWWRAGRFRVYVGHDAQPRYLADLEADLALAVPATVQRCILTGRSPTSLHEALPRVLAARSERKLRLRAANDAALASLDLAHWRGRFAPGAAPLRVMGVTSRFTTVLQHSMGELLAAAERAGCITQRVWERHAYSYEYDLPAEFARFRPDLVIMLSRMRYEFPDVPRGVPFLCWDQDNLPCMRMPQARDSLDRLTFVVGHAALIGRIHHNWPATQALPVSAAGSMSTYSDAPLPDDELAPHRCDLSFVSHCSETPAEWRERLAQPWQPYAPFAALFRVVTDDLLERYAAGAHLSPSDILNAIRAAARQRGVDLPPRTAHELYMSCASVADRAFRHCTLDWAARYCEATGRSLRLYGNGWERHPRFARHAGGRAEFGRSLRAVYQASRINLQLIETGFFHSRSLDGLLAGGFFLARRTHYDTMTGPVHRLAAAAERLGIVELPALLSSDDHDVRAALQALSGCVDWSLPDVIQWVQTSPFRPDPYALLPGFAEIEFRDYPGFAERAERFLADDAARQSLAARMRTVIAAEFSYDARWRQIIEFIRRSLARAE
ncbi:MAG: hypothetical protein U1A27_04550 [Phycisphaerae bacterium]